MLVNLRDFPRCISSASRSADVCVWVVRGRLISKRWHSPIKVHRVWRPHVGEKGHWRSLASRSWEHHSGSVQLTPTAAANILRFITCPEMAIKVREKKNQNKLHYLKVPSGQRFTFKSNLWCCDLYMIHERGGRLWHNCNPMLQLCHRLPRF